MPHTLCPTPYAPLWQGGEVPKLERSPTAACAPTLIVPDGPVPDAADAPADAPTAILIDLTAPEVPEVDAKARRDEADIETDPTPCKKTKAEDA